MASNLEKLEQLLLQQQQPSKDNRWVVIYGVAGVGKTYLARRVATSQSVIQHFNGNVFWIGMGRTPDVGALQLRLLQMVTRDEGQEEEACHQKLKDALCRKLCLIILDDVWTADVLPHFDVVASNGSKVLVTSRQFQARNEGGEVVGLRVGGLGDEDSLKLFVQSAGEETVTGRDFVKDVAGACMGIPLLLKVVGAAFGNNPDKVTSSREESSSHPSVMSLLRVGYDALESPQLQKFLVYFAAFPDNIPVKKKDLLKCWCAEQEYEQVCHPAAFETLCKRQLIQAAEVDGEFFLPNLIRELLELRLPVAEHCLFQAGKNLEQVDATAMLMNNYEIISLVGNKVRAFEEASMELGSCCSDRSRVMLLGGNPLETIPTSFFSPYVNLKVLSLSRTRVTDLPPSLFALAQLVSLDVSHCCKLKAVSSSLRNLSELQHLDLSYCPQLNLFPVDALQHLTRLRYFNTEFSPGFWQGKKFKSRLNLASLTSLQALFIDTDVKVVFPSGIASLVHLKVLHVYSSRSMAPLSTHFLSLKDLESLRLSPLAQSLVPRQLCRSLVKLHDLWLGFTEALRALPPALQELKLLRDLKLKRSSVATLQLNVFEELEEVDLTSFTSVTQITVLPSTRFQRMTSLRLTGCALTDLPPFFASPRAFPCLEELELRDCVSLRGIPSLDKLPRLKHLAISRCALKDLPPTFGSSTAFPCLTTLLISSGRLCSLPEFEQGALPSLESLTLSSSNLELLPQSLTASRLEELSLKKCTRLASLPENLTELARLKRLDLSHCSSIRHLPPALARLPLLEELELEYDELLCSLPLLPDESEPFPALQHLSITGSGISTQSLQALTSYRQCLTIHY